MARSPASEVDQEEADKEIRWTKNSLTSEEMLKNSDSVCNKREFEIESLRSQMFVLKIVLFLCFSFALYNYIFDYRPCFLDEFRFTS